MKKTEVITLGKGRRVIDTDGGPLDNRPAPAPKPPKVLSSPIFEQLKKKGASIPAMPVPDNRGRWARRAVAAKRALQDRKNDASWRDDMEDDLESSSPVNCRDRGR